AKIIKVLVGVVDSFNVPIHNGYSDLHSRLERSVGTGVMATTQ
ncbi:hypothetical protein LCGC14_1851650, partial [marine sediment metagenome]